MRCQLFVIAAVAVATAAKYFPARNGVPHCEGAPQNVTLYYTLLESSEQMPAQEAAVQLQRGHVRLRVDLSAH